MPRLQFNQRQREKARTFRAMQKKNRGESERRWPRKSEEESKGRGKLTELQKQRQE